MANNSKKQSARRPNLFISVVVPVYNDPEGIRITLGSLLAQNYPRNLHEVIVVDNNSSDDTRSVVEEFEKKHPSRVRLLVEKDVQSSYAARNKGISVAKGEIIALIDADMWADKNWLSSISDVFRSRGAGYVGYSIRIHTKKGTLVGLYNKFTEFSVGVFMAESHFAGAGCIAVSKVLFEKVGLFDPRLISGGDLEFGDRCWKSGAKQIFVEKIMLHHPARESLNSLMKKDFRIGRGHRQLVHLYPDRFDRLRRGLKSIKLLIPYNSAKTFRKKIRENRTLSRDLTFKENVCFYLLSVCEKTARNLGYFYEALCQDTS